MTPQRTKPSSKTDDMMTDYDEYGTHRHTALMLDLIQRIRHAKVAFNVPIGRSNRTDDRDYLEEVGRMTLEVLFEHDRVEI